MHILLPSFLLMKRREELRAEMRRLNFLYAVVALDENNEKKICEINREAEISGTFL